MLVQHVPVPEYPALHAQVNDPSVSVHAPLDAQLWVPRSHSFTLLHVRPSLPREYPMLQPHSNEPTVFLQKPLGEASHRSRFAGSSHSDRSWQVETLLLQVHDHCSVVELSWHAG